jgi:predicted transposase/invertase (TIGR01784 family)
MGPGTLEVFLCGDAMKTDALFYRLFQTLPEVVFELAGLDEPDGRRYRFRSEEVKQTAFRLDGVLEPPETDPEGPVVFVEVQMQADEAFYGRWFAEIFLYLYRMAPARPWRAVAIHPSRSVERLDERRYGSAVRLPEVRRVYLEDWADAPADTVGLRLVQLLVSAATEAPARARQLLRDGPALDGPGLPANVLLDWVETILVYKLPTMSREEVRRMLELHDVDLKQTRFYQEVFAEGESEGELKGELKLLRRLLIRRFGPLPAWAEAKLAGAEPAQLEVWGERVLEAATLEAVFAEG